MLEVTIRRIGGQPEVRSFQFENDALQAFFDALVLEDTAQLVSLRSLTSPLVLTGEMPRQQAKARVNEPIARAKAQPVDESQPAARTAGLGSVRSETPAKPSTERK